MSSQQDSKVQVELSWPLCPVLPTLVPISLSNKGNERRVGADSEEEENDEGRAKEKDERTKRVSILCRLLEMFCVNFPEKSSSSLLSPAVCSRCGTRAYLGVGPSTVFRNFSIFNLIASPSMCRVIGCQLWGSSYAPRPDHSLSLGQIMNSLKRKENVPSQLNKAQENWAEYSEFWKQIL